MGATATKDAQLPMCVSGHPPRAASLARGPELPCQVYDALLVGLSEAVMERKARQAIGYVLRHRAVAGFPTEALSHLRDV